MEHGAWKVLSSVLPNPLLILKKK
eukprot:SAG31_NODE_37392_length_304_cov_1.356098_1_plen_23_part_01